MKEARSFSKFIRPVVSFFTEATFLFVLRNTSRYIIGVVFIFSGFVKAIDPLGSAYKFTDYFDAWGAPSLDVLSLQLSFLLSAAELLIGLCIFFKIRMKVASWALLVFMSFFTVLTFIIALTNPVKDCGCFGDALILTNWQTFYKNLIFLGPTFVVFFQRNRFSILFSPLSEWIIAGILFLAGLGLSQYCYNNLPILDFRPYRIGVNIPEGMKFKGKVNFNEENYVYILEKDGVQKKFLLSEYPDPKEGWKYVDRIDKPAKDIPDEPPIHDFGLSLNGDDYAQDMLEDQGYSVLVVAWDLQESNEGGMQRVASFTRAAVDNGYSVYGMSSTVDATVDQTIKKYRLPFEFYAADPITLKTMVRSNPGILLIKEGTIIAKWSHRNIPPTSFFEEQGMSRAITEVMDSRDRNIIFLVIVLIAFLALSLYAFGIIRKIE